MAFRGTFDYSLDAKNRLTVPAKFRAELSSGVVLAKGLEQSIDIWTPTAYDGLVSSTLQKLNPMSPDARQLRQWFSANAFDAELDAAGRVQLPAQLIEHGGLRKEVVITGNHDSLQVWDREAWHTYNADLASTVVGITERLGHIG
jgi:MraZ protein